VEATLVSGPVCSWLEHSLRKSIPAPRIPAFTDEYYSGQFAIYGDIKKALGATGGVEIAK
jgi:hypothetical protein